MKNRKPYDYDYDIVEYFEKNKKYHSYLSKLSESDKEAHHFYMNHYFEISTTCKHLHHIFGYTSGYLDYSLIKTKVSELLANSNDIQNFINILNKTHTIIDKEILFKRSDGTTFWAIALFRNEINLNNGKMEVVCQFLNVSKLKMLNNNIQEDKLTNKKQLRDMIRDNSTEKCLLKLHEHFDDKKDTDLLNQIIILQSRFKEIKSNQNLDLVPVSELQQSKTKLNLAILNIINDNFED